MDKDFSQPAPTADPAGDEGDYLQALGQRVRDLRLRRGMTRAMLASDSGVSVRYLAQLEGGDGNISIIRLRQVAQALALPLEEIVRVGPEHPPEFTLLVQYLSRLSPLQLAEAREILQGAFDKGGRRQRIALVGLRGAGKSTLGKLLAQQLQVPYFEIGEEIERTAGMKLSEIFSLYGQSVYRRYERRTLQALIAANERFVLSTGGGIVSEPATFDELLTACYTVWIKATPAEHMARVVAQGDHRPMGDNREAIKDLERILAGREPMYGKADASVNTSGARVEESLAELLKLVAG